MKILLLGSNGMLGQSIRKQGIKQGHDIIGIDRSGAEYTFDLLNDERLDRTVNEVNPDVIINTAAIVSLELCEGNPGNAYCVNARLPGILASISEKYSSYLVHVSTDHFYTGDNNRAHSENDKVTIVNEYARTKYLGELLALQYDNSLVIRTNIVGFRGRGTPTFLEWAIGQIEAGNEMTLYNDFYTSSIYVDSFADVMFSMLPLNPTGVYNLSSSTVANKKQFILALSRELFGYEPAYKEGSVKSITGAKRAESLGLDNTRTEQLTGLKMPTLEDTIKIIGKEYLERKQNEI